MALWKKILIGFTVVILVLAGLFVLFIGPWPVYKDSKFETSSYYKKALTDIEAAVKESDITAMPGPLKAGWAIRVCTPPIGTPLGGYGDRRGKPSTGVHDDLYVKALALSDGKDTVVLTGSDLLLVPPNVAEVAWARVAKETPLTPNDILFTASHTHCGPGAWAPGLAGYITGGKYDPKIPEMLGNAFADAIIEAYNKMAPAKLAHGDVAAPEYIRNRARKEPVDSDLSFLVVEKETGEKCYAVRFSAHPTIYGGEMMQFSAEHPGALQRNITKATNAFAMYMGGSLGSSSPRAPEGPTDEDRIEAMGQTLSALVLDNSQNLIYESNPDIVSLGVRVGMPSMQMRPLNTKFRLSPLIGKVFGVPPYGWIQGVRVGKLVFIGAPFDFSGETSIVWKEWAAARGYELWPHSFCVYYCGYLSPDKYYLDEPLGYETGLMGWFGPNTEAYFTKLFEHAVAVMAPQDEKTAQIQ